MVTMHTPPGSRESCRWLFPLTRPTKATWGYTGHKPMPTQPGAITKHRPLQGPHGDAVRRGGRVGNFVCSKRCKRRLHTSSLNTCVFAACASRAACARKHPEPLPLLPGSQVGVSYSLLAGTRLFQLISSFFGLLRKLWALCLLTANSGNEYCCDEQPCERSKEDFEAKVSKWPRGSYNKHGYGATIATCGSIADRCNRLPRTRAPRCSAACAWRSMPATQPFAP